MRAHAAAELIATGLALLACAAARAESPRTPVADSAPASEATELEPITVRPPAINPLDESTERLRRMLEEAPCLGCGPAQDAARISIYEKTYYGVGGVLSFFTGYGEHPPEMSPQERAEARVIHDWKRSERAPAEVE